MNGPSAKFADTAVDALVEAVVELGGRRGKLDAVIAGGAKMFAVGGALDVGARNDEAVRAELKRLRIPIRAEATGGTKGRTVRVDADAGTVSVQEAGGAQVQLLSPRISSVWAASAK
jgi:chemotaxis protein CheD